MKYSSVPQLKLNFSLSQITHSDSKTAICLLVSKLTEREYKILEETNNSLIFYSSAWRLRWNFQRYIAFNGGIAEVGISHGGNTIIFNYYLDFFPLLLLTSVGIISSIFDRDYNLALFVAGVCLLNGSIAVARAKWTAKRILKDIRNQEVVR